jgi:hypothetical protein
MGHEETDSFQIVPEKILSGSGRSLLQLILMSCFQFFSPLCRRAPCSGCWQLCRHSRHLYMSSLLYFGKFLSTDWSVWNNPQNSHKTHSVG